MKKIFLVLTLIASLQIANAQSKAVVDAKNAAEAAAAATQNPKKAGKLATWMKLGQAMVNAYNAPMGNGWIGASETELQFLMAKDPVLSTENVTLMGAPLVKKVYEHSDYYFNGNGVLERIVITKPGIENALEQALDAYAKANELDVKGSKSKDICAALKSIAGKYSDEAYNAYTFGDYNLASEKFAAAAKAAGQAPLAIIDTNSIYNVAFTAWLGGNNEQAKKYFAKCIDLGNYGEDGEVYAKLADIAGKEGNAELQQKYLEEGFAVYPQSQGILVGLINFYIASGENTDRLFVLLDKAKANEPNNASLYYVEGNIHEKLGQREEAIAAYDKCEEINPNYEYGYIGKGVLYYNAALEYQDLASNEMDDDKYMAYMADFEQALKNCIEPFEKAFAMVEEGTVKSTVAEYLKNACFRFRTESEVYQQKYDKYSAAVAGN